MRKTPPATVCLKGSEIIFHLLYIYERRLKKLRGKQRVQLLYIHACTCVFVWRVWKLTWYAADIRKDGRYIGGQIQLSRENMISDYNSATPATLPPICSKLLFYIYCGHVNRTHAVGAMLIIRNWCLKG